AEQAIETHLARRAEWCGDMPMRQRADDGDGVPVPGDDGAALQQHLEPGDAIERPVGEVQQGALLDLAAVAVALAQQDGRGRAAIGDRFDVHGETITGCSTPCKPRFTRLHGYKRAMPENGAISTA